MELWIRYQESFDYNQQSTSTPLQDTELFGTTLGQQVVPLFLSSGATEQKLISYWTYFTHVSGFLLEAGITSVTHGYV